MSVKVPRPPRVYGEEDVLDYLEDVERQLTLVGSVTVNVGSIAAGAIETFTITVTGATVDQQQAVALAPPSALEAGLVWCGLVSADETVTVRLLNTTGAPINPVEATWGARVFL